MDINNKFWERFTRAIKRDNYSLVTVGYASIYHLLVLHRQIKILRNVVNIGLDRVFFVYGWAEIALSLPRPRVWFFLLLFFPSFHPPSSVLAWT